MANTEKKIDWELFRENEKIIDISFGPFKETVRPFVVTLLDKACVSPDLKREQLAALNIFHGSGTLIGVNDRIFIATAAHVIFGTSDHRVNPNNLWFCRTDGSLLSERFPGLAKFGGHPDSNIDVGYLEFDYDDFKGYFGNREVASLSQLGILGVGREKRGAWLLGSPFEMRNGPRLVNDHTFNYDLPVVPIFLMPLMPHQWPTNIETVLHESRDIFCEYPTPEQQLQDGFDPVNLPNPRGMSGGGFWDLGFGIHPPLMTNEYKLFGIQCSWYKTRRYVRGVQIIHWLRLIYQDYPDLRDTLNEHFPDAGFSENLAN